MANMIDFVSVSDPRSSAAPRVLLATSRIDGSVGSRTYQLLEFPPQAPRPEAQAASATASLQPRQTRGRDRLRPDFSG